MTVSTSNVTLTVLTGGLHVAVILDTVGVIELERTGKGPKEEETLSGCACQFNRYCMVTEDK
jgi:hypothetical protein